MSNQEYDSFGQRKYVFKINTKNPLRTRCSECGNIVPKRSHKRSCPNCGARNWKMIFNVYDFPHCPLCDHPTPRERPVSRLLNKCVLCEI